MALLASIYPKTQRPVSAHITPFPYALRFESQHLLKAFERNGVKKWVALSEGAGGTLGWLTTNERSKCHVSNQPRFFAHA